MKKTIAYQKYKEDEENIADFLDFDEKWDWPTYVITPTIFASSE